MTNYKLTVMRKNKLINVYINDELVHTWDETCGIKLSALTDLQVGLLSRGQNSVTYSGYTMSTSSSQINKLAYRTVKFDLPQGFKVLWGSTALKSGGYADLRSQITVKVPQKQGSLYTVIVNGEPIPVNLKDGTATFRLMGDTVIEAKEYAVYDVSGTVTGSANGSVTATNVDTGESYIYENRVKDGAYTIALPTGNYKLYFDCGKMEGILEPVMVDNGPITGQDLNKLYQKLTPYKEGDFGTAQWVLTGNGRQELQTSQNGGNTVAMGYFADKLQMSNTDFVMETTVEAPGNSPVMIGLALNGKNASGKNETVVFGLANNDSFAQIRVMVANGWPGFKSVPAYDRTNFRLMIVKQGSTITYFLNGNQVLQWTAADYDFASWRNVKVGLGIYRMYDVTFSDYSFTTDPAAVSAIMGRKVSFDGLPEGTVVTADGKEIASGDLVNYGTTVNISGLSSGELLYAVSVNGKALTIQDGTASFVITEETTIAVTSDRAYLVSGIVAGGFDGSIIATNVTTGAAYVYDGVLLDGSYSVKLPNGTFRLYFDCGTQEGAITGVQVNGTPVTLPELSKTYQKLTPLKAGQAGMAQWVMTDNGVYQVQTSNESTDSISMGWFVDGVNMSSTDFVIETDVKAVGSKAVMIGLALSGKNAAGAAETAVFGLNNSNNSAQIRVLNANGWPGYRNVKAYDRTNFHLSIVKLDNTITFFVDGVPAAQWNALDYDFVSWTDTKVGLGFYRMFDVTFSQYSYSDKAEDIQKYFPDGTTDIWDEFSKDYAQTLAGQYDKRGEDGKTTLFIGDSFFDSRYFWTEFSTDLSGKYALCAGISSSSAFDWENYMKHELFLTGISPKNIVMNIGTNDLYDDHKTVEETLNRIQRMFTRMHEEMPQANIYYFSIIQRAETGYKDRIIQVNEGMKAWCEGKDFITFVDVYEQMTTEDLKDGVHPKNECYPNVYLKALLDAGCVLEDMPVIATYPVSGTIGGDPNGTVKATDLADTTLVYTENVTNGVYAINLPDGSYKLYFDCGDTEGLIPDVTVSGAAVTAPTLEKTYQKLTVANYGAAFNGTSSLTDNGVWTDLHRYPDKRQLQPDPAQRRV